MRQDLNEIAIRLAQLHVPHNWISDHVKRVEKWRVTHPPKTHSLKRHRLNSHDDDSDDDAHKRKYRGTHAVFRKGPK